MGTLLGRNRPGGEESVGLLGGTPPDKSKKHLLVSSRDRCSRIIVLGNLLTWWSRGKRRRKLLLFIVLAAHHCLRKLIQGFSRQDLTNVRRPLANKYFSALLRARLGEYELKDATKQVCIKFAMRGLGVAFISGLTSDKSGRTDSSFQPT